MKEFEILIIGAGVIGTASARAFTKRGVSSVAILEKENGPAVHTSGRNSGVVHSGINPKPGGLKARFCVEGNRRLKEFCLEKRLPLQECGTVVVASNNDEMAVLEELLRRGNENGVPHLKIVDEAGLKLLEPQAIGKAALHAPSGAIASGREVTKALAAEAKERGVSFFFGQKVVGIETVGEKIQVTTSTEKFLCSKLLNCSGLQADQVAHLMGVGMDYRLIPFRGEYFRIRSEKAGLVRSMVYPAPDLRYPFLGVHWTKTVEGDLKIGPNAIIALGRESYSRWAVGLVDTLDMVFSPHFRNMVKSREFRAVARQQIAVSFSRRRFVEDAKKLVPGVEVSDFEPWKSGIRAQLVNKEGKMVDDIVVEKKGTTLHVLNAVSPGFTCSLPFADHLVEQLMS